MRRLLIIIYLLLCANSIQPQELDFDYHPFVEDGKEWLLVKPEDNKSISTRVHRMEGDTLIVGKHCVKWLQQDDGAIGDCYVYVYEEDRKVWFFYDGEEIPRLFFDFGAQAGDTLDVCYIPKGWWYKDACNHGYDNPAEQLFKTRVTVISRDYVTVGERMRHRFFIRYTDPHYGYFKGGHWDVMMDGVGSIIGPNCLGTFGSDSSMSPLIYCMTNDNVLYFSLYYARLLDIPIPTSINQVQTENSSFSNPKLYDLSGRRLSAPPAKGLYIENGKKRVAR